MNALVPLVTGTEVTFWVVAPLMVLGALGLVFLRKAVYGVLSMALVMVLLAVLYAAMEAPFLFAVQIIVYTGAILMLFLFVLMLVGIDAPDSTVETIKGQRVLGFLSVTGMAALLLYAIAGSITGRPISDLTVANAQYGGNIESLAALIFGRYVFVFELTSALLITAALGAMVLAFHTRTRPKMGQRQQAQARMTAYETTGEHPGPLPNSGVYATTNAIAAPALLPDGSVAEKSVSRTLAVRGIVMDPHSLQAITADTFGVVEAVRDGEEEDE